MFIVCFTERRGQGPLPPVTIKRKGHRTSPCENVKMETTPIKKEDLRVQKTKKALTEKFRQLLEEKRFEDITVNELCEKAGIRRATFYKHFEDKYDFLSFVVQSLRDDFDRQVWAKKKPGRSSEYYVTYVKELISFVNYYDKTFKGIMKSDLSHHLVSIMMEQNYKDTIEKLEYSVKDGMVLPASVEATAAMLTGGVGQILVSWIKDSKKKPVDDLLVEIEALIRCVQAPSL